MLAALVWMEAVLAPGYEDVAWCPKGSCLRPVHNPDGFVGPRSAMVECWDPHAWFSPLDEIWTGPEVVADLPEDWEEALPCPDPPTPPPPPTPPSPPAPPSPPPAPPTPPPLYVCLLHAGTFSRKLQVFATVRLETDKTNHCLVGGASGGLGSGQALADAYFPTVPENAMSEKDRHAHSCCLFDGRYMAMSGAEQIRVDIFDYDTFNENDYLGGAYFPLDKFAYLKHPTENDEAENDGAEDPEDDAGDEAETVEEEYPMTYSDDGPWHSPQPQTLTADVSSAFYSETSDFKLTIKLTRDLPGDCGVASTWGDPQALLEAGHLIGAAPVLASKMATEHSPRGRMVGMTEGTGAVLAGAVLVGGVLAAAVAGTATRRRRAALIEPML